MVKIKRSFPAPESLAEESKKGSGRYDKPDVIARLKEDFHNEVTMRIIRSLLRRESAFAAFKRCYVREHATEYPELQEFVSLFLEDNYG